MLTLEQNILREEYQAIANDIYAAFFSSVELTESYAEWLKSALLKNAFQTKEQKAHVIRFLAKLQTQKELLELAADSEKLQETHKASASFAHKTKVSA
ncbi:MAG: hypothetical protein U0X91_22170 [Spirosomataceae bacterium]